MSRIITDGTIESSMQDGEREPVMALCAVHEMELDTKAPHPQFSQDDRLRLFHVVTSIAVSAIGTEGVVQIRCPVCALRKFDFIGNLVTLLEERKRVQIVSVRQH